MPSPCWHLPLGFLRQRREQSCLLCCFTPHQLHFPHLKGQGKAPFQDAARADPLCSVSLPIIFPIWLPLGTGSGVDTPLHLSPPMGCASQDPKWTCPSKMLLSCLDAEIPIFPCFTFPLWRLQAQLMLSPNSFAWIFSFSPTNSLPSARSAQTAIPLQISRIWAFPFFYELLLKRRLAPSLTIKMGVP